MPRGKERFGLFEDYWQGVKLVASFDNLHVYGGSCLADTSEYRFNVIIDLSGMRSGFVGVFGDHELAELLDLPTLIQIPTHDGEPPRVSSRFMERLARTLRERARDYGDPYRVFVCCSGGHGRTGTFLAALIWYLQGPDMLTGDPIRYLRENYSTTAVETYAQLNWLNAMGVPTREHKPSREGFYGIYATDNGGWL